MPAGQTPVTVTVVAHNDLVDAVQPGDRYVYCTFENDRQTSYLIF
jgi:DNA replicative helicase MCM subunit Mcm2 (Cdc46/Mcm family)